MQQPPFEIRNRAELVDALSVAAQVEHVVLVEYLYAAFSCRHTWDASVPTAVQMTSWEAARELYDIAHDEMDHLGAVQQLLAALGAPPVPDAWPLPIRDERLPFPCELTRLDADAVDRFVRTESAVVAAEERLLPQPPDPIRFDLLGDLYRAIIAGIERLGDRAFIGAEVTGTDPLPLTFNPREFPVATPADAIASLGKVVTEGEGATGAEASGHWRRFEAMRAALDRLGPDAEFVSWPCVANPVVRESTVEGTTLVTAPVTVAVADIANRAYRALWLLLGGTFLHDWSASDAQETVRNRRGQRSRSMTAARLVMATVLRPLGEILARLPAFDGDTDGPTAGMGFEQYGEFRVPAQPDARTAATADELTAIADDLAAVAMEPELSPAWAGARLAAMAPDVRMIRERFLGRVGAPRPNRFEPPGPGRWLTVDFSGWYQVRLATGGDPYNDARGVSGWQFALAGEPDLDRVLRLQPEGTFLRPHIDPGVRVGVAVTSAEADDGEPIDALTGARVELLESPTFEGHNGVFARDTVEPIVPLCLRISAANLTLQRHAADRYDPPYPDLTSLGQFPDHPAALDLRERHGLPVRLSEDDEPSPELLQHLQAAASRLQQAIARAEAAGQDDDRLVLERRLQQIGNPFWPFGAVVAWRLRLVGADCIAQVPEGVPAPVTDSPWWLELVSTGFDPDAGCALLRGVLHAPLDGAVGPPPWRMALEPTTSPVARPMPLDAMGVRAGR